MQLNGLFAVLTVVALSALQCRASLEQDNVVNITALTDPGVLVDDDFMFSCTTDENHLNITLVIDGNFNSPKQERINTTAIPDTPEGFVYIFQNILPSDNGTTFMCVASNDTVNDTFASDVLTIQALSTPIFIVGSNLSMYAFILLEGNDHLQCQVGYANPPLTNLTLHSDSKNTDNVEFNSATGAVSFTGAKVNNRGNYTCTATNDLGNTNLTYETFIGGAPNNVTVQLHTHAGEGVVNLTISVNDRSDAPAQSLMVSVLGLEHTEVTFDLMSLHIPVDHTFDNVLSVQLSEILAANYSLLVTAVNVLGNGTALQRGVFLNGTYPLDVTVMSDMMNVTLGGDYMFECVATPLSNMSFVNVSFEVLIDGIKGGDKHSRLIGGPSLTHSQSFTFVNVSISDQDTKFGCLGNGVYRTTQNTTFEVFFAPMVTSPVVVPVKTVGDPSFTITVNYTANPPLSFAQWTRNGHQIYNDTHILPYFNTLEFMSLEPSDNGSYAVILYNDVGNTTVPIDLTVYYSPILSIPTTVGGFLNQSLVVTVAVDANPPHYNSTWRINGQKLIPTNTVKVNNNTLTFTNLTKIDKANYTLQVSNGIGNKSMATFQLMTYDGPYFNEGYSNTTVLKENRTGVNFTLTCTIKYAIPNVTELTIEPSTGPNWSIVKPDGDKLRSVTLKFIKAQEKNNTRKFTCIAKNGVTVAKLEYDNYIGGPPNASDLVVQITKVNTSNSISLSAKVADHNSVPVTEMLFNVEGVTKDNISRSIPYPPNNTFSIFDSFYTAQYTDLTAGQYYTLHVYAANMLGSTYARNYTFSIPDNKPTTKKKSHAGAVAAGVIIPLLVISLIVIAVAGYYYYYKKKQHRNGFSHIPGGDEGAINSSGYRTDKIVT